jgi:hypothetical protein
MTQNLERTTIERFMKSVGGKQKIIWKDFLMNIVARKCSGEMDTSLTNGFANNMAIEFICKELNIKCTKKVEGDDGITGLSEYVDPNVFSDWFRKIGLTAKVEMHDDLSTASFCGLVFDTEDKLIITNPTKVLAEFGWTNSSYLNSKTKVKMELIRAKGFSMLYQYPGCPIIQSLALYAIRATIGYRARLNVKSSYYDRELWEEMKNKKLEPREVPIRTRFLVEKLYGIAVERQLSLEAYLDSLDQICPLNISEFLESPREWTVYNLVYTDLIDPKFPEAPYSRWGPRAACI